MKALESAYFDGRVLARGEDLDEPVHVMVVAETRQEFDAQVAHWTSKGYHALGREVHLPGSRAGRRSRNEIRESWSLTLYRAGIEA